MAMISIILSEFVKNILTDGQVAQRSKSSIVKKTMQIVSMHQKG